MLTVQQSIFSVLEKTPADSSAEIKAVGERINKGLNNIQLGMDIAWDVLICIATILFSYSMIKRKDFWKMVGFIGFALGLLLLGFNLYHFPKPPESVGSIDWGPFVAIWYLVVSVILLTKKAVLPQIT
jgi:amino acid permease